MRGLKGFRNFKERGEWIELRFMAEAMRHGYKVLKPWGESAPSTSPSISVPAS